MVTAFAWAALSSRALPAPVLGYLILSYVSLTLGGPLGLPTKPSAQVYAYVMGIMLSCLHLLYLYWFWETGTPKSGA